MSLIRFQLVIRRYLRQNKCNVISHVLVHIKGPIKCPKSPR